MDTIMAGLMSGGWAPDDDLDIASDYELAMERAEAENPELFQIAWEPYQTCSASTVDGLSVETDELPC